MRIDRKQFLMTGLAALGAADLLVTAGCGSDDDGPAGPTNSGCQSGNASVEIGSNHRHQLVVSAADVAAGQAKTYDITGQATHAHQVTLSSVHFERLKAGESVLVESTATDHTHPVTVRCG
jgi:hypothetical protein